MGLLDSVFPELKSKKLTKELEASKIRCGHSIGALLGRLDINTENSSTPNNFEGNFKGREIKIATIRPNKENRKHGLFQIGDQAVKFTFRFNEFDEAGNPILEDIEAQGEDYEGKLRNIKENTVVNLSMKISILSLTEILIRNASVLIDEDELIKKR